MDGDREPMNPYEAPRASLEGQTTPRGYWTGRVVMDLLGGLFWVPFGLFWGITGVVTAIQDWKSEPRYWLVGVVAGFGTLALGLFFLWRVDKVRRLAARRND